MDWFDGLTLKLEENGNTLLSDPVIDQSTLHEIMKTVRDLEIPLLSDNSVDTEHFKSQMYKSTLQVTHE